MKAIAFALTLHGCSAEEGVPARAGDAGGGGSGVGGSGQGGSGAQTGIAGSLGMGGAGSGAAGADAGGTALEGCTAYAASYCARLADCAPHHLRLFYEDALTCPELVARECERDVADSVGIADPTGCAAGLESGTCEEMLAGALAACAPLPADVASGEPCHDNEQCESGICRFSGSVCGSCAVALDEGTPCEGVPVTEVCGPGLACDVGGTGLCQARQRQGLNEPCGTELLTCAAGLFCGSGATCLPVLLDGEPCGAETSGCDIRRALYCIDDVCGPLDVLVQPGAECGLDGMPFPRCSAAFYCEPSTNQCVRRAQAGESCDDDPVDGSTCDTPFTCVEGTCLTYEQRCL